MKKLISSLFSLIIVLCFAASGNAQTAQYGNENANGFYDSYITKAGNTINVGDTLVLGTPSGNDHFLHIQQGEVFVAPKLAGEQVVVSKIKAYGKKNQAAKVFMQFKGYGLPVFIDYENALAAGEVANPNAPLTKPEAIAKLKEAKELLDLGVITAEKYEDMKNELTPVIVNN